MQARDRKLVPGQCSVCHTSSSSGIAAVTARSFLRPLLPQGGSPCPIWRALLFGLAICSVWGALSEARCAEARHGIAMHGEPALPEGFSRLPYADPNAPKGGRLVQGVLGTFDSLNPFIVKGIAPQSIRGYVVESLMARGYDEPFTLYGLIARSVETDAQRSYVTFQLDPAAKFSDGKPVTAEDVIFSWQILRDKGRPNHRTYYAKVAKAEAIGEHGVRFDLSGSNDRELPAHPRADAGARQARRQAGNVRRDFVPGPARKRPLCRR